MDECTMINALSLPTPLPHSLPLFLPLTIPLCFLGGLALGYVYFRALQKTIDLFVSVSQGPPFMGMALTLGRLTLLALGLYFAVLMGGLTLLAMLAGIVSAKALMFRKIRHASP
ncbi:ATP synthase subunit I [Vreelandella boliviensis]|nr:ATP synthase subunit I [Halomonas boliviensis]